MFYGSFDMLHVRIMPSQVFVSSQNTTCFDYLVSELYVQQEQVPGEGFVEKFLRLGSFSRNL